MHHRDGERDADWDFIASVVQTAPYDAISYDVRPL